MEGFTSLHDESGSFFYAGASLLIKGVKGKLQKGDPSHGLRTGGHVAKKVRHPRSSTRV